MQIRYVLLLLLCFSLVAQIQYIDITSVTTGAGYLPGITRPGGISIVFCTGLTGINGIQQANAYPLPTELAGISVLVNGVAAPLLAVADLGSYQQINFQVPNLPDMTRAPITVTVVETSSGSSVGASIKLDNPFNGYPADLFRDSAGYGVIQHGTDGSPVTPENPAQHGEVVIAYATGMGAVEPPIADGQQVPQQPPSPLILYPGELPNGIKVFFCQPGVQCMPAVQGSYTNALFAGLNPGGAGVYRIEFRIPDTAPSGDIEVGILRTYCYDAPCTLMSPFQENFVSERVKISIR